MKLSLKSIQAKENWAGYHLPSYDPAKIAENTALCPQWMHFGSGNIFRIFPAVLCQRLIEQKKMDTGIVSCEGYDDEIITKCFRPYDNLTIAVTLNADGRLEKEVVGSMSESLTMLHDSERIAEVFKEPSLQMVSFTITEKGYSLRTGAGELAPAVAQDMAEGPENCRSFMAQLTAMCLGRRKACGKPLALVSMDNCSHNGEKLQAAVTEIAEMWLKNGKITQEDFDYLQRDIAFPWSMIDKITPRPHPMVEEQLIADGLEDISPFVTSKHTYTAPFVNAEKTQYLVIEDKFPNGRPPLEDVGVIITDRDTVNKVEKMKVCTCLNPLHTCLAVYGCLLGYTSIAEEMKDPQLKAFIDRMSHEEGMPFVVDPGVIDPARFLKEVLTERFPNPFMPDTPQRIATDTSQKLSIRYGETIKAYMASDSRRASELKLIPLVLAGWLRYLTGIDDQGEPFEVSPDPLYASMKEKLGDMKPGSCVDAERLRPILSDASIFGVNLYQCGLADKVIGYFEELMAGKSAVRRTLEKYV
ncbi:MAG: mannitol dehydrogenase family protein [Lachnospiraceae bacterium]|jgi:fructuronate reductase|nr:mannitol dehydrogenase family protein [Lachnospiraceae bacterium]